MPTPRLVKIQPITAWSYSRHETYNNCPLRAKFLYIDKLKEPDSAAGANGTRVHALAAAYVSRQLPTDKDSRPYLGEIRDMLANNKMPDELVTFEKEFKQIRKLNSAAVEQQWCFDKNWNPVDWFASSAWLRIKVDLHYLVQKKRKGGLRETTVYIVDHKTGKEKSEHALQRSLYALGAFLMYPDAVKVVATHWYLDPGRDPGESWTRDQLPALKQEWLNRTKAMLSDTTFAPRPGDYCRWCVFSKAKGGSCPY